MKTTIYNRNNWANNFRNRMLKVGAMLTSMTLCSFAVFAQNDWKQLLGHTSMGEMARMITIEKAVAATSAGSYFELEEEPDKPLEIENWMTNADYFSSFKFGESTDPLLNVEAWMSSDIYFLNYQVVEKESELEIDAWMTDEGFWLGKRTNSEL